MESMTRLEISSNRQRSDALQQYVGHRLQFALGRWDHRIDQLQVRLEDVNGPRGGLDKRCRIIVAGRPSWRIQVEGTGTTFYHAIDSAAARARRSVGQLLKRLVEERKEAVV